MGRLQQELPCVPFSVSNLVDEVLSKYFRTSDSGSGFHPDVAWLDNSGITSPNIMRRYPWRFVDLKSAPIGTSPFRSVHIEEVTQA